MADPIITDHYRVMVVFKHASGLPQDVFINSFVFRNDGLAVGEGFNNAVESVLTAFYTGTASNGSKLTDFLDADTLPAADLRIYDLGETPPRTPHVRENFISGWTNSGNPLPHEVALCLSYQSTKKGPRGRGRIFLGPLATTAMTSDSTGVVPSSAFRLALADRAYDLMSTTENLTWVLLSQVDQDTSVIQGGYVDNAFDTIRKRGLAPTARDYWGVFQGINYQV